MRRKEILQPGIFSYFLNKETISVRNLQVRESWCSLVRDLCKVRVVVKEELKQSVRNAATRFVYTDFSVLRYLTLVVRGVFQVGEDTFHLGGK